MQKLITSIIVALVLISALPMDVLAESTGKSYAYNHAGEATPIPDPYRVELVAGSGLNLLHPEDMVIHNGLLYILDSGNKRVVVLDEQYEYVREITFSKGGSPYALAEPKGIWIDKNETMYIADRSNHLVFLSDMNGNVIKELGKPKTDLMTSDKEYLPIKVLTDHLGVIYVMVENEYRGMVTLNSAGDFLGYFGSNNVTVTGQVISDLFWRKLMTQTQINKTQRILPMEYSNFAIDDNGFIYGVRGTTSDMAELIRKINCKSKNVLDFQGRFGDIGLGKLRSVNLYTKFNAITVDDKGFITTVDTTWNRLFQYTGKGDEMYIFGGSGEQAGTFSAPVDVESMGDRLLVLDKNYGTVTVLIPTEFGASIRKAQSLYEEGRFQESLEPWSNVSTQCINYEFAYTGIGKVRFMEKDYKSAMKYFKLGHNRSDYSLAFRRLRSQVMRDHFIWFAVGVGLLCIISLVRSIMRKKGLIGTKKLVLDESGKLKYLLHIMIHPIEGYEELRYNKKYSMKIANCIIFGWFFVSVLNALYNGFIFNGSEKNDYNVWITLCTTLGIFALFSLVNWLMSIFFEGKGTLRQVWIYCGYALLPMVVALFINLVLTNVLTQEEAVFVTYLMTIANIWSGALLFFALKGLHMYSFKRNIVSILTTIAGILVVLFIVFLMFNLLVQFLAFIEAVYKEARYRVITGF